MPTDKPKSDGTLLWDSTTMLIVKAHGGDQVGLGYIYKLASTWARKRTD